MINTKNLVITLDGPAGAGKSTVAKSLAKRLGVTYLDTGAMYRALTLKGLRAGIDLADEDKLAALARQTKINFIDTPEGLHVTLDGEDVATDIRSTEVTNNTFYAARAAKVRELMVEWQRELASGRSLVTDGRDQGTVVFPKANFKFYIDASVDERLGRRLRELRAAGKQVDEAQLRAEMVDRDNKDMTRAVGPLKQADDAIRIDSTGMTVEDNVDVILKLMGI